MSGEEVTRDDAERLEDERRRTLLKALGLGAGVGLATAGGSTSATERAQASPSGDSWQTGDVYLVQGGDTVQAVVNDAERGDVVIITQNYDADGSGDNTEPWPITIDTPITLVGWGDTEFDIHGAAEADPIIKVNTPGNDYPGFATMNLSLARAGGRGMVIDGRFTYHYQLDIVDCVSDGLYVADQYGSSSSATNSHKFFGCQFYNNERHGVFIDGTEGSRPPHGCIFQSCRAVSNTAHGFYFRGAKLGTPVTNTTLYGCNAELNGDLGIFAKNATATRIDSCYVEGNDGFDVAEVYLQDVFDASVSNCYFNDFGTKEHAIRVNSDVSTPRDVVIENCGYVDYSTGFVKVQSGDYVRVASSNTDLRRTDHYDSGTTASELVTDTTSSPTTVLVDDVVGAHVGGVDLSAVSPPPTKTGIRAMSDGTNTSAHGVIGTWDGSSWQCTDGTTV